MHIFLHDYYKEKGEAFCLEFFYNIHINFILSKKRITPMDIILGIVLLLAFLVVFSLFTFFAPEGSEAMGAMADAAVASFLVEAVFGALFGEIFGIAWLTEIGTIAGGMSGVAAGTLVAIAMGVSPVYAVMIGIPLLNVGILPGFIAGYLAAFVVRFLEAKVPGGFDMVVILFIGPMLTYLIGTWTSGPIDGLMLQIGATIEAAAEQSPILMGFFIGGLLTVISTAPISSMAVTAMIGLSGQPMAIAGLAIFGTAACNYIFFKKLRIGDNADAIAVTVEPLTAADLVAANPIPIFSTNFVSGGIIGVMIALSGMVNNSPGTASVVPGIIAAFAWNPPLKVLIYAVIALIIGGIAGYLGALAFRNFNIIRREDLQRRSAERAAKSTN